MAERTYTIPLRRTVLKQKNYKRTEKAVKAVREFLTKHMKADDKSVKLGPHLNEELWKNGIKNPPGKVKVTVNKDKDGVVRAELVGAPAFVAPQKEDKSKQTAVDKAKAALAGKADVKEAAKEKAAEKKEEAKAAPKKEAKAEPKKDAAKKPEAKAQPAEKKADAPKEAPAKK